MSLLTIIICGCAVLTALVFTRNLTQFRQLPPAAADAFDPPAVSVLIPARDEAAGIGDAIHSVLANRSIKFEVVVLDDQSRDGTAGTVRAISDRDERVRLIEGRPLPAGWCGKQFACHQLAQRARYDELLFLDADVRLAPDSLVRAVEYRRQIAVDLLSGFPRQVVSTLGEAMLVPLIYIVLLSYLPFELMRRTKWQAASAGCGQFFLTTRQSYGQMGGHGAIRDSLHDGITLPRAFRRAGLATDVFDASDIASCRMYRGWWQTWQGFSKNAYEGLANPRLIVPMTGLMLVGYVAPTVLLVAMLLLGSTIGGLTMSVAAVIVSYLPRLLTAKRFDHGWLAAALFPLSIVLLVVMQWVALCRHWLGSKSQWRGRVYAASSAGAND